MSAPTSAEQQFDRATAFLAGFARRQAAVCKDFEGGFAVRDPAYAGSHEHNQLVVDGTPDPAALPALADELLAGAGHRRITVLSQRHGEACAGPLAAAGYARGAEVVMIHQGPRPEPVRAAEELTLDEVRSALTRQTRVWMPHEPEETVRQLVDRRSARLRGADEVLLLGVRQAGDAASWADLYRSGEVAQFEDLVTADAHTRRGYADVVLATALHRAADADLFFLLADPDDWPQHWYARRGFVQVGRVHVFTRYRV
ncbi:GNAT family N-acetyltransferase [Streptacidiphilus fuscans]|uniref:GNAT family N-acetyltransferase n=1 Tax=Streptacidiphilus fuscans TaxID=2789292 RepID=A0A931B8K3_9ACTN|nr:GNAT family N-acetyltransferase [Streptacidiphilus fuscans]MBF9072474.1 GNAT family N-acetyltransferase [Streptacidiphilus fuscans]